MAKKDPIFRFVRHRRIKLKSKPNQWLNSIRLTSCLSRYDSYYFSPSRVSLVSSLPDFKFKTPFDYELVRSRHRITLRNTSAHFPPPKRTKKSRNAMNPLPDRPPIEQVVKNRSKVATKTILDKSSDSTICYDYQNNDDINLVDDSEDIGLNGGHQSDIEDIINTGADDNDNIVSANIEEPSISSTVPHKKPLQDINVSTIETIFEQLFDKKFKQLEQSLRQSMIKTSTPIGNQTRHHLIDPNVSQIIGNYRNRRVISIGIQAEDVSITDKMTQTIQTIDKSVQTDITCVRRVSTIDSSSSVGTDSKTTSSPAKTTTDSDPECPFPPKFRAFLTKKF